MGNTMLHLVAWEAEQQAPELLALSDDWQAIWAASEVSYKQVDFSSS
jgi:hypothetical protein